MLETTFTTQPDQKAQDKPQPLETQQVEAFLSEHLGNEVQEVSPIGKGNWSQAFSFRQGDADLVARFGMHVEDFSKDKLASKFATPDLPVPSVLEMGQALGRHFCLSERAYGEMLEGLSEDKMRAIVPAVFRMLDSLREANVDSTTGFGLWHADGNASQKSWAEFLLDVDNETERVHGWHANMAKFPDVAASYNEVLEYLKSHLDLCPEIRHLLHTDLLHFNVMVGDGKINAVVDWGNGMYGDFLYELAAFSFYAPWYPAMADIDWRLEARRHLEEIGCEVPNFEERLKCYEAHIGLGGMAYSASIEEWKDMEDNANRAIKLIRGEE